MLTDYQNYHELWIIPVVAVSGLVLGYILERLVLRRLLQLFGTRGWQGEASLRQAATGFIPFGFFIAGIFISIHYALDEELINSRINVWAKVLFISFLTIYISRSIGALIRFYTGHQGAAIPNSSILVNLVRFVILIIGFVIVLNAVGISITPILTALGVGGLAVALALQDTLGNLFAGLQILAARKITTGQFIQLDSGDEGQVEDIAWRNTTIRTLRNNVIVIPNTKLANAIITNYSAPTEDFSIAVDGGVSYESDLSKVQNVLLDEAVQLMQEPEFTIPDFQPSVYFTGFLDSGISFRVFLRSRNFSEQIKLRHRYIQKIHARFILERIEMPYSKRDLYWKSGTEIPSQGIINP
jgi:small-conductance mechanosensitive channel